MASIICAAFRVLAANWSRAATRSAPILGLALAVAGCATNKPPIDVALTPSLDNFTVPTALPLRAGIYYSPEFERFQYQRDFINSPIHVHVGHASVPMFDRVLQFSFREVVRLENLPLGPSDKPAPVDVIIEARIHAFHYRVGFESDSERHSVTYQLRMYDPQGTPIGARLVRGKAAAYSMNDTFAAWSSANLRDAADKVPAALREMWSSYQSRQAAKAEFATIDPASIQISARRAADPFQLSPETRLPLAQHGIIAVTVSASNGGTKPVLLRDQDAALLLPNGRALPLPPTIAVLHPFERPGGGAMAGGVLINPLIGVLAGMAESAEQVEKRAAVVSMLDEKGFRERTLRAGESAQATVFFIPGDDVAAFSSAELLVWLVDPDSSRATVVKVPVAGVDYRPLKPVAPAPSISSIPTLSDLSAAARADATRAAYPRPLTGRDLIIHLRKLGKVEVKEPSALLSLTFLPGDRLEVVSANNRQPSGIREEGNYRFNLGQDQVCINLHSVLVMGGGGEWMSDCFHVTQTAEKAFTFRASKGNVSLSYVVP